MARHLPAALPIAYGHVGDGNVHYNVLLPRDLSIVEQDALLHRAEHLIFELVDHFGGSISAEHGVGRVKLEPFRQRLSAVDRDLLQTIKSGIDPDGRMSPGRLFAWDAG